MPRIRAPHKDRTELPRQGRKLQLGPIESLRQIEDGLRVVTKLMAGNGDLSAAAASLKTLAWIRLREKELEARGLNMDDQVQRVILKTVDYRDPYEEQLAKNKEQAEQIAALEAQIAALGGKDRPRPPRPNLN
jgi:hypothetical protein